MAESDNATGGPDEDRPTLDVACIDSRHRSAALVSTAGNHCQVWRSSHKQQDHLGEDVYTEYVVKYPVDSYGLKDILLLARQHRLLHQSLGEIVPEALFVHTLVDGEPSLIVLAQAVNIWFNIANPSNREEAIGLLRDNAVARAELSTFLRQAKTWREATDPRVIDLFGLDNLVMDNDRGIRYIDSFYVFFFEDLLHMLGGERDFELEEKIDVSLRRLAYLEDILTLSASGD